MMYLLIVSPLMHLFLTVYLIWHLQKPSLSLGTRPNMALPSLHRPCSRRSNLWLARLRQWLYPLSTRPCHAWSACRAWDIPNVSLSRYLHSLMVGPLHAGSWILDSCIQMPLLALDTASCSSSIILEPIWIMKLPVLVVEQIQLSSDTVEKLFRGIAKQVLGVAHEELGGSSLLAAVSALVSGSRPLSQIIWCLRNVITVFI